MTAHHAIIDHIYLFSDVNVPAFLWWEMACWKIPITSSCHFKIVMKRKSHLTQVQIFRQTQNICNMLHFMTYKQAVAKIQTENTRINTSWPFQFLIQVQENSVIYKWRSSFFTGAFADHLLCPLKIICFEIFIFYMMHWNRAPKISLKIAHGTLLPSSIVILLLFLTSFATSLPPRVDFGGENFNFLVFPVNNFKLIFKNDSFFLNICLTHIPRDVYASESTLWCVRSRTE